MLSTLAFFVGLSNSHATMYEPPTRNSMGISLLAPGCEGGACLWFTQGSWIGCPWATGRNQGCVFGWLTKPMIDYDDKTLRTFNLNHTDGLDWTRMNPWRKPGSAPVADSCGLAGGWTTVGGDGFGGE